MTEPAQIESFKIELRLDATVEINGRSWVKPGVTTGTTWSDIPEEDQLKGAVAFLNQAVIAPVMEEVMELVIQHTKKAHGLE